MARVTIDVTENVEDVIEDIENEVIDELKRLNPVVESVLDMVRSDAKRYVKQDADYSGNLRSSIRTWSTDFGREGDKRHRVGVKSKAAKYAAIVELGTGNHTLQTTDKAPSQSVPNRQMDEPPADFPFSAPTINPDPSNPTFMGFVGYIEQWMRRKGITPEKGSYHASAMAISYSIIENGTYAHPFLRPAWFERELELRQLAQQVVRDATR
jgi:hypothetical protein